MYSFAHLINIVPEQPETWQKKIFLTFDNDWAHNHIIRDTVDLMEEFHASATFFVTDHIPQLEQIKAHSTFTLGIHPTFRPLLIGQGISIHADIDRCMQIIPDAISCRSHGNIQGGDISQAFIKRGIRFESNESIPFQSGIKVRPYALNGPLIKLPYFWADEHEWLYDRNCDLGKIIIENDFCMFHFNPIHVFFNFRE